ncbi:hypothetical protein TanjilG_29144 [Lupinus angustifolius]|uniref:Uncharacterized protein n=1 Tax=Lupinus angustifolius TaxID=3871 RepID=A0A1J7H0X0_LUPAN|nr:hypothetical protein TanjilG_29144 [Lupinus angustifolius]
MAYSSSSTTGSETEERDTRCSVCRGRSDISHPLSPSSQAKKGTGERVSLNRVVRLLLCNSEVRLLCNSGNALFTC